MYLSHTRRRCRLAFTMVELLVTVAIIAGLTAIALPTIKESLRSNMVSSAANVVSGALINARAISMARQQRYGIRIERRNHRLTPVNNATTGARYPLNTLAADPLVDKSFDFEGLNYGSRIYYAQSPKDYLKAKVAYPFATLQDPDNNCTRSFGFFVSQSDADLLYAAAKTPDSRAGQLISVGTSLRIGSGSSTRVALVRRLIPINSDLLSSGLLIGFSNAGPVTCPPEVIVPTGANAPAWMLEPGTVVITEDEFSLDPARSGSYSFNFDTVDNAGNIPPVELAIEMNPVRAPFAPINLAGKASIDFSVSGSRTRPIAFGIEGIASTGTLANSPVDILYPPAGQTNDAHDIIIMFSADGSVDSIYFDVVDGDGNFILQRFPAPPSLSLLVGYSDGVLPSTLDLAVVPDKPMGVTRDDLRLRNRPNFTNPECAWVTLNGGNGNVRVDPVADVATNLLGGRTLTIPEAMAIRLNQSRSLVYSDVR